MRKTVIFDLDGTLADIEHRVHWLSADKHSRLSSDTRWKNFFAHCVNDRPNLPVIAVLQALRPNYKIAIFTGRSDEVKRQTEDWLKKNGIEYDFLRMRKSGDHTRDEVLKAQWLKEYGAKNIFLIFEDRDRMVKMWRDYGLTCFQVADGRF